jgi:hypothetical protein
MSVTLRCVTNRDEHDVALLRCLEPVPEREREEVFMYVYKN